MPFTALMIRKFQIPLIRALSGASPRHEAAEERLALSRSGF